MLDGDKTPGDATRVYLPHPEILAALEPGHKLLLDDGKIRLVTTAVTSGKATTRVEVGGKLSARKGVSLPDTTLTFSGLMPKDRTDLEAALDAGIDWIALSFIQRAEDIAEAKKITRGRAAVMAKVEKPQALGHLDGILEIADAIMVARGDLGVELPIEQVPGAQKQMTRSGRRTGKPVVVATQMLESMISSPVPTRAEVSDVATAIFEGADAVMLSAESASGQYPVEAVTMMDRIAIEIESDPTYRGIIQAARAAISASTAAALPGDIEEGAGPVHELGGDRRHLSAMRSWRVGAVIAAVSQSRSDRVTGAVSPTIAAPMQRRSSSAFVEKRR